MTKLPYLLEMEPDEWLEAVRDEAESLADAIAGALGDHDDAEGLLEAVEPLLEPYFLDPDDPTDDELRAEISDGSFFAGQKDGGSWLELSYRDDGGYWWIADQTPDGEKDPDQIHGELATRIVESVDWADPDHARDRANTQRAKRAILGPFLEAVDEAGGREATAADVRGDLEALVDACLPGSDDIEIDDRSPDDDHTHFVIVVDGEESGHVLATSPGRSRAPERLKEVFGIEPVYDAGVRMVTDHMRFVWPPFANTQSASSDVILPSEVGDDNRVDYYFAIDRAVSLTIRALNA